MRVARKTSVMNPNDMLTWGPYELVALKDNNYECMGLERQSNDEYTIDLAVNGLAGTRTCTSEKCFCFAVPEGYQDVGEDGENYDCFGQLLMFESPFAYKERLVQHDLYPCQGHSWRKDRVFGKGSQSQEHCYCKNTWSSRKVPRETPYLEMAVQGHKFSCSGFFRGFIEGPGFTSYEIVNFHDRICEYEHCLCWTPGSDYVTVQPGTEVSCPQKRAIFWPGVERFHDLGVYTQSPFKCGDNQVACFCQGLGSKASVPEHYDVVAARGEYYSCTGFLIRQKALDSHSLSSPEFMDEVDHPCGGEQCMCRNIPGGYKVVAQTNEVFRCYGNEMFINDNGYGSTAFTMNTKWSGHECPARACACKARPFSDVVSVIPSDHKLLASSPTTKISCVGSLYTFSTLSGALWRDNSASIVNKECGNSKCYCKQFDIPPNGAAASVITLDLSHDHRFVQPYGPYDFNACQSSGFKPDPNKYYYLRIPQYNQHVVGSVARPGARAKDLNEGTQVRLEKHEGNLARAKAQWRFEMDGSDGWIVINRYSGQKLAQTQDGHSDYKPVDMSFNHQDEDSGFRQNTMVSTTLTGSKWYASCEVGKGVSFNGSRDYPKFLRLNEDRSGMGTTANYYKKYKTIYGPPFSCPTCQAGWTKYGSCKKDGFLGNLSPTQSCYRKKIIPHMEVELFFEVTEITDYLAPDLFADTHAEPRGVGQNQDEQGKFRTVYWGGLRHAISITSVIATTFSDASDAIDVAADASKLAVKVTADVTKNLKVAGVAVTEASEALEHIRKVGTGTKFAKAIVKWMPVMSIGLELLDLSLGLAFPQPTVDDKLNKLEKEMKDELKKATTALAGDLAVKDLETVLFTCMSTLENEYKSTRQTVVADAARAFQTSNSNQLTELDISEMSNSLLNCIRDISEVQKFNPQTVASDKMLKYAQYGFKSLENYALQTMVAVQEFVVLKVFHSMYYKQHYEVGDTAAFKSQCDSYIASTGFFSAGGGSLAEVLRWMNDYQQHLIAQRLKQLTSSTVDARWDYHTIKDTSLNTENQEIYKLYTSSNNGGARANNVLARMKEEITWDMKNIAYSLHAVEEVQGVGGSRSPMEKYTRNMCVQMFEGGPSGALIRAWMATSQAILPDNYPNNYGHMEYTYLPSGRQCIGHNSNDPYHTYTTKEIKDIRNWAATSIDDPAACSPPKHDIHEGTQLTVVDCGQFNNGHECQVIDQASAAHYLVDHPELVCPPEYPFLAYKSRYCA